ncbi:response regulator [Thalassobellus suaedae]|uniref:Response regulator n=1 Tax=Thalassobellus suaedae TaxID=3074124 RepID=A0ABY9Y2Y3_9FLAO|nr:response regulator [Flavobacteriaceae bacterium HL-DH14]WNH12453.1 response regulator [Flavobacteriaceae bacterium HL-DH10]
MSLNILIVDDDSVNRFILKKKLMLSQIHDNPLCFENGLEALNYLTNSSFDGDIIVFLDLYMPIMNGWEFLERIEKINLSKKIKVYVTSSSIDTFELEKVCLFNTVLNTFSKPISNQHMTLVKNELMAS